MAFLNHSLLFSYGWAWSLCSLGIDCNCTSCWCFSAIGSANSTITDTHTHPLCLGFYSRTPYNNYRRSLSLTHIDRGLLWRLGLAPQPIPASPCPAPLPACQPLGLPLVSWLLLLGRFCWTATLLLDQSQAPRSGLVFLCVSKMIKRANTHTPYLLAQSY